MILKELRYNDTADIHMRLSSTIIRYRKSPVFIHGLGDKELHVRAADLLSGQQLDIHSSDEELDISSPPLGYCNPGEDSTIYVVRCPRRMQKQGFYPQYAFVYYDKQVSGGFKGPVTSLGPTIVGNYPSFEESVQRVKDNKNKKSFGRSYDRYFSIWKTKDSSLMRIKHLIDDVGIYIPAEGVGLILPDFKNEIRLKSKLRKHMELVDLNGAGNVDG
jgi:hypothetical protein